MIELFLLIVAAILCAAFLWKHGQTITMLLLIIAALAYARYGLGVL